MITVVLDNSTSLDASDIYKPLLYRSMRNECCFYIKSTEIGYIDKIKNIVKYYPKKDYEIIIITDLFQTGESLIEKIYLINHQVLSEVYKDVKRATKVRYLVLDYINGNYLEAERKFITNIESIQTEAGFAEYLNRIKQANNKITWIDEMVNSEFLNVKDFFIEKILPQAEINLIPLNKMPNEERENFIRNLYLKVYGFINLIAENIIEEDLTICCYKEVPIYQLNIELNEKAIEETSKRYRMNLEKEEQELELKFFDKIEYTALFDDEESNEEYKKVIDEINQMKLKIKQPKVTLFNNSKDLQRLEGYIDSARKIYIDKSKMIKNVYGNECIKVRDDLNKEFKNIKSVVKERFEIENKIKEEKNKIEQLKYKKSKLLMENREELEEYEDCLEKQKIIISNKIRKRKIISGAILGQCIMFLIYIIFLLLTIEISSSNSVNLNNYIINMISILFGLWLVILIGVAVYQKINIKMEYKNSTNKLEKLFLKITQSQREGTESIQLTRQMIKSKRIIKHLESLLEKFNVQVDKIARHQEKIINHKNFSELIIGNLVLDGTVEINDLSSKYMLQIDETESYKNKLYSFMDYIPNNKYSLSLKKANTSKVIKIENAGTYISYVSME